MTVPYTFGNESSPIPLSQLDANFATIPLYANTAGNVVNAVQANITSVGTLTSLLVSGNVNSGNLLTSGILSATSNISAGNISTGGEISVYGTVTGGSFSTVGSISATGNLTAGGNISASNVSISNFLSVTSNITTGGNVLATGQISAQGNITAQGIVSATGNITTAEYFVGNFLGNITGNLSVGGSNTQVLFNESGNVGAAGGFTYNKDSNTMVVLGVISAQGNVNVGGNINVTSNAIVGGDLQIAGTTQFVGLATAPTAPNATSNNQVASTAFVNNAINQYATGVNITGGIITNISILSSDFTVGNISSSNISSANISGSNISGGNISGLATPLPVASGGIGAITLTANAILVGNGSSAPLTIAPGTNGNVLTSNGTNWISQSLPAIIGLGFGGTTWHNVTGSRAFNTTYTNSYSYPIMVSATTVASGPSPYVQAVVSGVQVSQFLWQFNGAGAQGGTSPVVVPPGATYALNSNAGLAYWAELY